MVLCGVDFDFGGIVFATSDMMPKLIQSCPSFHDRWKEHQDRWQGRTDLALDLSEFAYHVVELVQQRRREEFPRIFEVIEGFYREGDDKVKRAATIGILDSLQNTAQAVGIDLKEIFNSLQPESARAWKMLDEFWEQCLRENKA